MVYIIWMRGLNERIVSGFFEFGATILKINQVGSVFLTGGSNLNHIDL